MSQDSIRQERLKKLKLLEEASMDAYPVHTNRTHEISSLKEKFEDLKNSNDDISIVGRVMSLRQHGGIIFADIFDGSGKFQFVLKVEDMQQDAFDLFTRTVDRGDFIECLGNAFVTKRGEPSLKVASWKMLSKSISPIPDEWFGIKDEEIKCRRRYLDILFDEEVHAMFMRRSLFWNTIRQFFLKRGFIEVETPVLETTAGGAEALPFRTHHNALDIDVYLRISTGELWQKKLLIAGYQRVFEIGRIFRNEGISTEHLQDYTQLEYYEAYSDYQKGMCTVKDLYCHIADEVYGRRTFTMRGHNIDLDDEWEVVNYVDILHEKFGINVLEDSLEKIKNVYQMHVPKKDKHEILSKARLVDKLFKILRKDIVGPAFLIGVPVFIEPLAKRSPKDERIVERFQIIMAGSEIGKGFSELNDPIDQKNRFEDQQRMRDEGDDEAQMFDVGYVEAMEYGMPPAFGFGVSERLFSYFEDKSIRVTQIFPLLREEQ